MTTKVVSLEKIESNRRNARRSTGPRTEEGKGIAKMNAVRHGILSEAVVVEGLEIGEDEGEFRALRERSWKSLAPVGPAEELLVDRIVTAQWRLRRVLVAETGEIALSVEGGRWQRSNREPIFRGIFLSNLHDPVDELMKSTHGLDYLSCVLETLLKEVVRDGELTEVAFDHVRRLFGNKSNSVTRELEGLREKFTANPDGLAPEVLKENFRRAVVAYIERELNLYRQLRGERQEREEKEEAARQAADILPGAAVLDKIMRYEITLERQLYRAMDQLERLQRRRDGEEVPPPLNVELSQR